MSIGNDYIKFYLKITRSVYTLIYNLLAECMGQFLILIIFKPYLQNNEEQSSQQAIDNNGQSKSGLFFLTIFANSRNLESKNWVQLESSLLSSIESPPFEGVLSKGQSS